MKNGGMGGGGLVGCVVEERSRSIVAGTKTSRVWLGEVGGGRGIALGEGMGGGRYCKWNRITGGMFRAGGAILI